ncbi:hypothetical protein V6N13_027836 [Hibiscus sabdariffa]
MFRPLLFLDRIHPKNQTPTIVASPAIAVVACTRHRRDSGEPFDEPRLPTALSFPFLPPSRSGFDHLKPRMSQNGARLMWVVRSTSSLFDVVTISDPRCRSSGHYGCARVPEKILSLIFSFSVCASITQGPKCPEFRLNSYGSRKDDSLSFKLVTASIPKTATRLKVSYPRPFCFGFRFLCGLA